MVSLSPALFGVSCQCIESLKNPQKYYWELADTVGTPCQSGRFEKWNCPRCNCPIQKNMARIGLMYFVSIHGPLLFLISRQSIHTRQATLEKIAGLGLAGGASAWPEVSRWRRWSKAAADQRESYWEQSPLCPQVFPKWTVPGFKHCLTLACRSGVAMSS